MQALNKMVDYWKLGTKLNFTIDPCPQNATWAAEKAYPRIASEYKGNAYHITRLLVRHHYLCSSITITVLYEY